MRPTKQVGERLMATRSRRGITKLAADGHAIVAPASRAHLMECPQQKHTLHIDRASKMPIYTPHGLKIRLDADAVADIVQPLASVHDIEDVLLDVELWENLPEGMAVLGASATAAITQSWTVTVAAAVVTFTIGSLIRSFTYSDVLRRLIPLSLGSWPVTVAHTFAIAGFLIYQSSFAAAIALCVINFAAHAGYFGILDLLVMPLRVPLRRALGLQPTHQESVFVAVCNRRAAQHGIQLNWNSYGRGAPETGRSNSV